MADVTGPISTLPGAIYAQPEGAVCDNHPDRPATVRIQGETDSFGCEMYDYCDECAKEHRREIREDQNIGDCDWCSAKNIKRIAARDYEEGMCGRVYQVCHTCKKRQNDEIEADLARYGDDYDYED